MIAYLLISLKEANEVDIFSELEDMKEVEEVHILFGEWDIIAKINLESPEALGTFVMEKIRSIPEVNLTSTLIAAK